MILEVLRPGIFFLARWSRFRRRPQALSELLNRDVIPALREHGKKLGLVSPFEAGPRLDAAGARDRICNGLESERAELLGSRRLASRLKTIRKVHGGPQRNVATARRENLEHAG